MWNTISDDVVHFMLGKLNVDARMNIAFPVYQNIHTGELYQVEFVDEKMNMENWVKLDQKTLYAILEALYFYKD